MSERLAPPPRPALPHAFWALLAALGAMRAALALAPPSLALAAGSALAGEIGRASCRERV